MTFIFAANLGSLRQECCSSNSLVVIGDYVEMIRERTAAMHDQVVQTKKTLIDNKIEIDRHYPDCKAAMSKLRTYLSLPSRNNSMCN